MNRFNSLIKILIYYFYFVTAESGDLIDYNYQNSFSLSIIDISLSTLAGNLGFPLYPISVYDIHYESRNPDGGLDTLSGLVTFPQSPTKAFPIAVYHHGTISLDDAAPSITGMSISNMEIFLIGLITSPYGFITMFPDYEGLGDSENYHPYTVSESYTRATVNMLRAIRQLPDVLNSNDRFQSNDQLFLIGYSEGGYATLATQRGIQLQHTDEFQVTASFPMAGPYDLAGTMVDYFLSEPIYPEPYYLPYVLTSYLWYYQGLDVDFHEYFQPFWADTLPSLFDGTHSSFEINQIMPNNPLEILLPQVLDAFINNNDHFFRQSLQENTLLDWTPQSPTYIYHGLGDDIVPYENAVNAYNSFVNNGALDINLVLYPEELGGHSEIATICLLAGYEVILDYQIINSKGDINGDGSLLTNDLAILIQAILLENNLTNYESWAGDIDYNSQHSIFDLLQLVELLTE